MKQYHNLLEAIKEKGTYKAPARENMPGTLSLFGYQFRHDLSEGFPLVTTKKLSFKNIVVELLWFLKGDTNIKFLVDNGCNIWNEDAYNYYKKLCKKQKIDIAVSFDVFVNYIKNADSVRDLTDDAIKNAKVLFPILPKDYILGDCGIQYGKLWRELDSFEYWGDVLLDYEEKDESTMSLYKKSESIDQMTNLIKGLISNPFGRRHIIDSWNPSTLDHMALNACHCLVQFNCRPININDRMALLSTEDLGDFHSVGIYDPEGYADMRKVPKYYLDCQMYQRSADVFLGVPYNIASYGLLTHMIAKFTNMLPGDFIHTFGDVHIYDNHKEQVNEQLSRDIRPLPELDIQNDLNWNYWFDDVLHNLDVEDWLEELQLVGYDPHPRIKAKLSTGLK